MKKLKKIYGVVIDFICRLMDDNVGVYAAQASFFIIIAAVPFIMLLLSVLKLVLPIELAAVEEVILEVVPPSMQEIFIRIAIELFGKSGSVSIISITAVTTLWLSSRGVMALYQGLNTVYHADIRNYFYCRAMSLLYTFLFLIVIAFSITVFVFGGTAQTMLLRYAPPIGQALSWIMKARGFILFGMLTVFFSALYTFLPRRKPRLRFLKQLPGAVGAAACWMIFTYIYTIYIENFSNYSYVYGSLTAVVFLMLWLYFCMNIFMYGAQLNKMLEAHFFEKSYRKLVSE